MFALVPEWARNYSEFWDTIKRRNSWFIKLRYWAVILLSVFLIFGEYILDFRLSPLQELVCVIIILTILIYNTAFYFFQNKVNTVPLKFNQMHFSLLQMILDLLMLMLLVYFTGGYNSQIYLFFIFHMIIGSLILPGRIIYIIATFVVVIFNSMIVLEHFGYIPLHRIEGLLIQPDIHKFTYDILFMIVFSAMIYISVFLANTISRRLYRREQQLYESLENEKKAEILKQRYIMGVVHEIKTPVSATKSILELISNGYLGEISEAVSERINRALIRSDEAIELINNILKLSRLKLLDISVNENFNLADTIKNIISRLKDKAESKNISLIARFPGTNEVYIKGDKALMDLAISNIISNSIKYNEDKGNVIVELTEDDENIKLTVDDDGVGIPNKELTNVYDQFYRASNVRVKSKYEGSGIGLSLVKEIIEKHNGKISIKSPSRIGTTERAGVTLEILLPKNN